MAAAQGMQPLYVTPVEPHGQACREPFGLETCRRAHVESLRAERPPGRTTCGTDKTFHLLPQGVLGNFCTNVPVHRFMNPNSQISSKKVTGRREFIGRNKFIAHYLIFHSLGLRFSRKALIPSLASSVADIDTPMLFKYSMALLIGISAAL
jgi:hypothetical protein